ncbi:mechanosensitive ion channel family protein [candidate division KSB1 bacterium]|nr:mechanosensitive ion channel family protein [candidate division KSB1 bacterium]
MIETIKMYLEYEWVLNGLKSLALLALFGLLVLIIRKVLNRVPLEKPRRMLVKRWITRVLWIIYGIVLVRIWAVSDLFAIFRKPYIQKILHSLIAFAIVYIALFFTTQFINQLKIEIAARHQYRKRAGYIATFIYILALIPIWAETSNQWVTVFSVMGAGIALALHEMLLNIAGWFYIVIRHPYRTGDRIELGSLRGDVIDIRLFQTTLLELGNWVDGDQSTGRVVHMPHGQIFRNPLFNYTQGFEFLWNELPVLLTFESDWEKAKSILLKFGEEASKDVQEQVKLRIDRMSREYLIYYKNFTPIVYTKIEESGVKITLRYLTEARKRRSGENTISQKVLQAINLEPNIDFAYPTYRIYKRGEDGS